MSTCDWICLNQLPNNFIVPILMKNCKNNLRVIRSCVALLLTNDKFEIPDNVILE